MYNYKCINLHEYFNHKCSKYIEDKSQKKDYKVGCEGCFLVPEQMPREGSELGDIKFIYPDYSGSADDNIVCKNQKITNIDSECVRIHFLGFCNMGEFSEQFECEYSDGTIERNEIFFYNWENYDYSSSSYKYKNSKNVYTAQIQYDSYRCLFVNSTEISNKGKVLKSINLPFNPFIHILAITIEKD